ncbi:predicted protein [Naegleria gruberi]|uniref:Predicted protein n=1 Tax=Naegleria gruberi TaxID=5762 RepID=D2V7X2_NAEGR|nr:uncharacterized protein NAEGRDRAFT_64954 [Naegleria gruberi]EFC46940.1 predicted protein [Naegleria gruberi]|eukprot:XP_002679684.1 predicted protein [Naegleria gruberi strain NEG-M]
MYSEESLDRNTPLAACSLAFKVQFNLQKDKGVENIIRLSTRGPSTIKVVKDLQIEIVSEEIERALRKLCYEATISIHHRGVIEELERNENGKVKRFKAVMSTFTLGGGFVEVDLEKGSVLVTVNGLLSDRSVFEVIEGEIIETLCC